MINPDGSFQIEDHVATHHQDLLDQATAVEKLENELSSVSLQSEQLLASVENTIARNGSDLSDTYDSCWFSSFSTAVACRSRSAVFKFKCLCG